MNGEREHGHLQRLQLSGGVTLNLATLNDPRIDVLVECCVKLAQEIAVIDATTKATLDLVTPPPFTGKFTFTVREQK